MISRVFHLYVKDDGPYELVPSGWSLVAALLGPVWAIANGLFLRYVLLTLPVIFLVAFSHYSPRLLGLLTIGYIAGTLFFYFPLKAFAWRESVLLAKGYTRRASIVANSGRDALRKYAASVTATSRTGA